MKEYVSQKSIQLDQLLKMPYAVVIPDSSLFPRIPAGIIAAEPEKIKKKVHSLVEQIDALDSLLNRDRVNISAEARMHFLTQRDRDQAYAEENGSLWQPYAQRLKTFQVPEAAFFPEEYAAVHDGFQQLLKLFRRASGTARYNSAGAAYAALCALVDPNEPQIFLTRHAVQQQALAMIFEFAYSSEIARNAEELTIERMLHEPKLYVGEPDIFLSKVAHCTSTVSLAGQQRSIHTGSDFSWEKYGLSWKEYGLLFDRSAKKSFSEQAHGILVSRVIKPREWIDHAQNGHRFSQEHYDTIQKKAAEVYWRAHVSAGKWKSALEKKKLSGHIKGYLEARDLVEEAPDIQARIEKELEALRRYVATRFDQEKYDGKSLQDSLGAKRSKQVIRKLHILNELSACAHLLDNTGDDQDAMHQLFVEVEHHMVWITYNLTKQSSAPTDEHNGSYDVPEERPVNASAESIDDKIQHIDALDDVVEVAETESTEEMAETSTVSAAKPLAYTPLDSQRKRWVQTVCGNLRHLHGSPLKEGSAIGKKELVTATSYTYNGLHQIITRSNSKQYWPRNTRTFLFSRKFIEKVVWHMQYEPVKCGR